MDKKEAHALLVRVTNVIRAQRDEHMAIQQALDALNPDNSEQTSVKK